MIDRTTQFYDTAKNLLDEFVGAGGDVDNLGVKDHLYKYIKDTKIKDKNGNYLTLEEKFSWLEHPRKSIKRGNLKQELINQINAYKQSGGSFHVTRKSLPFYSTLHSYSKSLQLKGIDLPHEQLMKGLGFKDYSDTYYRCMSIFDLKNYRDSNGFVDDYRGNPQLKAYISSLAKSLDIPYYLVITLLANEELNSCFISTEYVGQVQEELMQYANQHNSLKSMRSNNPNLYYKLAHLAKYYSDGSGTETDVSIKGLIVSFGFGDLENNFKQTNSKVIDINPTMENIRQKFGNAVITSKDLDSSQYRLVARKAIALGVPIETLFNEHGLNYHGLALNRLSSMKVTKIPYLTEMRQYCDALLKAKGFIEANRYCKEEIFEARVAACKEAYEKFKDKMFNFTIEDSQNLSEDNLIDDFKDNIEDPPEDQLDI